jgi:hypothetical protein
MSLAKEINNRLDEILYMRKEMERMETDLKEGEPLKNITTGEKTDKEGAKRVVEGMIDQVKEDLMVLTNKGQNVRDIFTNKYYINDFMQDREILESAQNN